MNELILCEGLFNSRAVYEQLCQQLRSIRPPGRVRWQATSQLSQGVDGILVTDKESSECESLSAANIICHINFVLLYLNTYVPSGARDLFNFPTTNGYYRSLALENVTVYLTGFNRDEARKARCMRMVAEMGGMPSVSGLPGKGPANGLPGAPGAPRVSAPPGIPGFREGADFAASELESHGFFSQLEAFMRADLESARGAPGSRRQPEPGRPRFLAVVGNAQTVKGLVERDWPEDKLDLVSYFLSLIVGTSLIDYLYNEAISTGIDLTGEGAGATNTFVTADAARGPSLSRLALSPALLAEHRLRPFAGLTLYSLSAPLQSQAPAAPDYGRDPGFFGDAMAQDLPLPGAQVRPIPRGRVPRLYLAQRPGPADFYCYPPRPESFKGGYQVVVPRRAFVLSSRPGGSPEGSGGRGEPGARAPGGRDRYRLSAYPASTQGGGSDVFSGQSEPHASRQQPLALYTHTWATLKALSDMHDEYALTPYRPGAESRRAGPEPGLRASLRGLFGNYRLMVQLLYCKPLYLCFYDLERHAGTREQLRQFLKERLLLGSLLGGPGGSGGLTESSALQGRGAGGPGRAEEPPTKRAGSLGGSSVSSIDRALGRETEALDYLLDCCGILPAAALDRLGPALKQRLFIVADISLYRSRARIALLNALSAAREPEAPAGPLEASLTDMEQFSIIFRSGGRSGGREAGRDAARDGAREGAQHSGGGAGSTLEGLRRLFETLQRRDQEGYNVRTSLWLQLMLEVAVCCHTEAWRWGRAGPGGAGGGRERPLGVEGVEPAGGAELAGLGPGGRAGPGPTAATPTQHLEASRPQLLPTVFPLVECASAALSNVALGGWKVLGLKQQTMDSLQSDEDRHVCFPPDEFRSFVRASLSGAPGRQGPLADSAGLLLLLLQSDASVDRLRHAYLSCLDLIPCDGALGNALGVTPAEAYGAPVPDRAAPAGRACFYMADFAEKMVRCCGDFRQSWAASAGAHRSRQLRNEKPGGVRLEFREPTDLEVMGSYFESRSAVQKSSAMSAMTAMSAFEAYGERESRDANSAEDVRFANPGE